jgi:hypothetical protein
MNYFYDLPDDLIDMIYKELHKKKLNKINNDIKYIGSKKEKLFKERFGDMVCDPNWHWYWDYLDDPVKFILMVSVECLFDLVEEANASNQS